MKRHHLRKEMHAALEHVAENFAPLPKLSSRSGISEQSVLKMFIALAAPECPQLSDFASLGFTMEMFRRFLTLYNGRTLVIPRMSVWRRLWLDLQLWLEVEHELEMDHGANHEAVVRQVALRHKLSYRYVDFVAEKLTRAYGVVRKKST